MSCLLCAACRVRSNRYWDMNVLALSPRQLTLLPGSSTTILFSRRRVGSNAQPATSTVSMWCTGKPSESGEQSSAAVTVWSMTTAVRNVVWPFVSDVLRSSTAEEGSQHTGDGSSTRRLGAYSSTSSVLPGGAFAFTTAGNETIAILPDAGAVVTL